MISRRIRFEKESAIKIDPDQQAFDSGPGWTAIASAVEWTVLLDWSHFRRLARVLGPFHFPIRSMALVKSIISIGSPWMACLLLMTFCGCFSTRGLSPWSPAGSAMSGMGRSISRLQNQLERNQDAPELNVELGKLFLESGQLLPASRQVDLALQRDNRLVDAWILRGDISTKKSEYPDALASYQHAIGLGGDKFRLLKSVADCYQQQGRSVRAAATLENLMSQYPADQVPMDVVSLYGDVMLQVGQYAQAAFAYRQVCRDHAASEESFIRLSEVQSMAGEHDAAAETLRKGRIRFPDTMQEFEERYASRDADLVVR